MSISNKLFADNSLDQFKKIETRLQGIQTKIASGTRIPQSSEQPLDAVTLSARKELDRKIEQFQNNLGKVNDRLSLVDNVFEESVNLSIRIKELLVQGNTDTLTHSERMAIRTEVINIQKTLISIANTVDSSGDALFGGFSTEGSPFSQQLDSSVTYNGDGGEHSLQVSESIKLPTSINGSRAFLEVNFNNKTYSSFDIINSFANSLLTNEDFTQEFSRDAKNGLLLNVKASRSPQLWSMDISGPGGISNISATINSDSSDALVDAINNASIGLTASLNSDGNILISSNPEGEFKISNLQIEGNKIAQVEPKNYIQVLLPDGLTQVTRVSDFSQGLDAQADMVSAMIDSFSLIRTTAGARLNNAQSQETILANRSTAVKTEIGKLNDADIQKLITDLQSLLVTQNAARSTYTKLSGQSLFDFLR